MSYKTLVHELVSWLEKLFFSWACFHALCKVNVFSISLWGQVKRK